MGNFYFDETIQNKAGFIIGAFVYSENDLTPKVFSTLESNGLRPRIDEFKSSYLMVRHPEQVLLRKCLSALFAHVRVGVIVLPATDRKNLGAEALRGLKKIVLANSLSKQSHDVFLDENIQVDKVSQNSFINRFACNVHSSQDSKLVGGIQLADLVAHSLGIMLREHLGVNTKKIRVGEGSGYDPDLEVELGFMIWASLRYSFFKSPQPNHGPDPNDPMGTMDFDVENYGLHISPSCDEPLRKAAIERFGVCYLGCIH